MSDGLLKKTGAANLFMVFGEPDIEVDIEVKKLKDGELQVELREEPSVDRGCRSCAWRGRF